MEKELEVGKDYGDIFGLDKKKGQHMIYNGGISWTASQPGKEPITRDSQGTTNNAMDYINRPSYRVGQ